MLRLATKFNPLSGKGNSAGGPLNVPFERAYRAGFRHAELWLGEEVLANWETVAALACHYPAGYALHFPNKLDLPPQSIEQAVHLKRTINARCMVIHQPQFDRFHESLLELDPELRLAIENHRLDREGLEAWAEQSPWLTLDVEHMWKFTLGSGPLEILLTELKRFLDRFAAKLAHVHLPGYWPGLKEHRPMYCSREMIFPVLSLLDEVHFDGLVVSEVNPEYQNDNDLRMDVLLFDTWRQGQTPRVT